MLDHIFTGVLPRRMVLGPAQDGLDAGHHLPGAEGLDDIVVRAQLQAHDLVHLLALGGEHDDGDLAGLADLPTDVDAGFAGHHDVQHAQGNGAVRPGDGGDAVIEIHGLESFGFQIYFQRLMYDGIIVGDQNLGIHYDPPCVYHLVLYQICQKWEERFAFLPNRLHP